VDAAKSVALLNADDGGVDLERRVAVGRRTHCRHRAGTSLLTGNVKHFAAIEQLKIERFER